MLVLAQQTTKKKLIHGKEKIFKRSFLNGGEPDTGIQLPNGHRIYQYTRKTMYSIPDPKRSPLRTDNGNLFSNYDEPWNTHQTVIRSCQTSFETTADGHIIHISFKGNNCVSNNFLP